MSDYVTHFAVLILALFGIGFYSATSTFRKIAKESEQSVEAEEIAADRAKRR